MGSQIRSRLYIAGGPGGSSIGPKVHEYVGATLGLQWKCDFLQQSSVESVMKVFREADFAGGLVTMPHKRTIIPYLDHCDELVDILGACNCVYLDDENNLRGTNTDWVGISDTIMMATPDHAEGRIGMVYGAGGASRAAIYALWAKLRCRKIYLVNRDADEIHEVIEEVHRLPDKYWPEVEHIQTIAQCQDLPGPYYTVCTIPDFEASTRGELQAREIFRELLVRGSGNGGLVLDMCYHPRVTRNLSFAEQHGYRVIQGHTVSAAQFAMQWKLWAGRDIKMKGVYNMIERLQPHLRGWFHALNAADEDIELAQTIFDSLRLQGEVDKRNKKETSMAKTLAGLYEDEKDRLEKWWKSRTQDATHEMASVLTRLQGTLQDAVTENDMNDAIKIFQESMDSLEYFDRQNMKGKAAMSQDTDERAESSLIQS